MATKPRRVDFAREGEDFDVALLGSLGKSTKFICNYTGLTPCQVSYRLAAGRVKRKDYRDGTSAISRKILKEMMSIADPSVRNYLDI